MDKYVLFGLAFVVGYIAASLTRTLTISHHAGGASAYNTGGLTVNSNGASDILTVTADKGTGAELWTLGIGAVTLSLSASGKFVTDDGFSFPTPVVKGTAYKREIIYTGGQLVYRLNGVTHSRPAAKPNLAPVGCKSGVEGAPARFSVSVSNFGHTKNTGTTYHLYDGTPDTTKRINTGAPTITMTTTQKGAGYTA